MREKDSFVGPFSPFTIVFVFVHSDLLHDPLAAHIGWCPRSVLFFFSLFLSLLSLWRGGMNSCTTFSGFLCGKKFCWFFRHRVCEEGKLLFCCDSRQHFPHKKKEKSFER